MIYCILVVTFTFIAVAKAGQAQDNQNAVSGTYSKDPASQQLPEYKNSVGNKAVSILKTAWGEPVDQTTAVLTAGKNGPILLADPIFLDLITHLDHERIPERLVHAKGAGAFGYFECTHDITEYTKMAIFSNVGKRTPCLLRMSTVVGERGSADTVRDPRGFALKCYTEDGNWDLVGQDTPVFWIRDPILFPSFVHSQKRNPVTNLKDWNMFWDFLSLRPETMHQTVHIFSDRGIPLGFRHMHGFGVHTFKFVNDQNDYYWVKFHFHTDQKLENFTVAKAANLSADDPDWAVRDLYNAIHTGNYPSWTVYVQIMTPEQGNAFKYDIFDATKIWPEDEYPLIPCGKLVLNQNPTNYFEEVEQAAFCPDRMIPGIQPSGDRLLQGRMFSYGDTQRHRLGPNFLQLPVNCPYKSTVTNNQRDGPAAFDNQGSKPIYYPNSFKGAKPSEYVPATYYEVHGHVDRYDTGDEYDTEQPGDFYRDMLTPDARTRLIDNMALTLNPVEDYIKERVIANFLKADVNFGNKLKNKLGM